MKSWEDVERYIFMSGWNNNITLPIVLCSGKHINENWDDVMSVAFDTYFVSESTWKVIGIRY